MQKKKIVHFFLMNVFFLVFFLSPFVQRTKIMSKPVNSDKIKCIIISLMIFVLHCGHTYIQMVCGISYEEIEV